MKNHLDKTSVEKAVVIFQEEWVQFEGMGMPCISNHMGWTNKG